MLIGNFIMAGLLSETWYFCSDISMIDYFNFKEKVTNFTWDMQLRDLQNKYWEVSPSFQSRNHTSCNM